MSYRRHHTDLGSLVEVHHPCSPVLGWAVVLVISLPFALLAGLGAPGPVVGLVIFLVLAVPLTYGFGEWLFLQNRLYEHGIVLRSVPGLRVFVIPHYTVDPADFEIGGRRVHDGGAIDSVQAGREGRFRISPFAPSTVLFTGLHPRYARMLAKGGLGWRTAGDAQQERDGQQVWAPQRVARWGVSYREPERHRRLVADTVRNSQQTVRPYLRAGWPDVAGPEDAP